MKCTYCGYEYEDNLLRCPFCNTENTKEAREQQRETIWSLHEEGRDTLKNIPARMLQKSNRTTGKFLIRILTGIIAMVLLVTLAGFLYQWNQKRVLDRNLNKLEQYLQAQDFDQLCAYMDDLNDYSPSYEKFYDVYYACRDLSYAEESLDWYYDSEKNDYSSDEIRIWYLAAAISGCLNTLNDTEPGLSDQLIQGNEAALEELASQSHDVLTLTLLLTDKEIQELLDLHEYYYDPDMVMSYAALSFERMHEQP